MGGLEQASLVNAIFLSMAEAKERWREILAHSLKNWMQKDKDNYLHIVYGEKNTHIL